MSGRSNTATFESATKTTSEVGVDMSEKEMTDAYWIHVGELRAQEKIINRLKDQQTKNYRESPDAGSWNDIIQIDQVIDIIRGLD